MERKKEEEEGREVSQPIKSKNYNYVCVCVCVHVSTANY